MDTGLDRHLFDRRLYTAAAMVFALIVLVGFSRTYYVRVLFDSPPLPSGLVHVHGFLMTAWLVLFVTQVRLISSKRIRLHQRLGYASIGLGVLIIATGIPTALRAAKYGSTSTPVGISPLAFLVVPLLDLFVFALLFGAAIYYRRKPEAHKSLMLLAAVNFLPPALGRIPIGPLQILGPLWFFGVPTALALLCLVLDARRYGRINKVFLTGTILLICFMGARLALITNAAWMNVAQWLTSFV